MASSGPSAEASRAEEGTLLAPDNVAHASTAPVERWPKWPAVGALCLTLAASSAVALKASWQRSPTNPLGATGEAAKRGLTLGTVPIAYDTRNLEDFPADQYLFGALKVVKSDYCLRVQTEAKNGTWLGFEECYPWWPKYDAEKLNFVIPKTEGQIHVEKDPSLCAHARVKDGHLQLRLCEPEGTNPKQQWKWYDDGSLRLAALDTVCLGMDTIQKGPNIYPWDTPMDQNAPAAVFCSQTQVSLAFEVLTKDMIGNMLVRTTTPAPAVHSGPAAHGSGSLYCWAVMNPNSNEPNLLQVSQNRGASVFACDGHSVFSPNGGVISGVYSIPIGADNTYSCGAFACNTRIFMKAWVKVVEMGQFRGYGWTVKVDPDAGFFPDRLRGHLSSIGGSVFIANNGGYPSILGPIEIFSKGAMEVFASRKGECLGKPQDNNGEDGFISDCFGSVLGVQRHDDYGVLINTNDPGSCGGGTPTIHHLKDEGSLNSCYDAAR